MDKIARIVGITVWALFLVVTYTVPAQADRSAPLVAPIDSKPGGQTYGRWAAEWWQWALGIPAVSNPLTDITGEFCDQRQVDKVWFLAGTSLSDAAVVRYCHIPAGRSLFFPLINNRWLAFLNDSPEERTEEFIRAKARCAIPAQIEAWIDGRKVHQPTRFFTGRARLRSPIFSLQLPPGNVFGVDETIVPELVLSPSAEEGYYLFVYPLPPGKHVIQWTATGCTSGNSQNITYHLSVVGKSGRDKH
jgi:hypothetical protein